MAKVLEPFLEQPAPAPIEQVTEYLCTLVSDAEKTVLKYQKRNRGKALLNMHNEAV